MKETDAAQTMLGSAPCGESGDGPGETEGENPLQWKREKPQFNVKAKGLAGYVGNAWLQQSKFGKYIRVFLREDVPRGTVLFVSPRKEQEGLLGR